MTKEIDASWKKKKNHENVGKMNKIVKMCSLHAQPVTSPNDGSEKLKC